MKTQYFDKRSLHCRLATKYGDLSVWDLDDGMNICDYLRYVIKGTLLAVAFALISGLMLGAIADAVLWTIMSIMVGERLVINPVGSIGLIIIVVPMVVGIIIALIHFEVFKIKVKEKFTPPSFLYSAYESFKDKVCFKVEFK